MMTGILNPILQYSGEAMRENKHDIKMVWRPKLGRLWLDDDMISAAGLQWDEPHQSWNTFHTTTMGYGCASTAH